MAHIENVKGIVWDLDGTLLDSFGIFEDVIADIVSDRGYQQPAREHLLRNYHGTLDETIQQAHHYDGDLNTHLYPDAITLAQQAAKHSMPQVLITNRSHEGRGYASPRAIIAGTVLNACIQEVRPGDEVTHRKPDSRAMGDWAERNQLKPHEILVVGDQFVDAQLAIGIGARAILVKRNAEIPHLNELVQEPSIYIVNSLTEVEIA